MTKADYLFSLAQSLAGERPSFFDIKGPGAGDHDTAAFMKELRSRAATNFGTDDSEKKICGENNLCVDFYFRDEETIVEVALGLRNPASEFERDVLKAIMAKQAGNPVTRLMFISKPGALKRLSQPGLAAIRAWADREQGIKIDVREITQPSVGGQPALGS
jgi:hypothetical protein